MAHPKARHAALGALPNRSNPKRAVQRGVVGTTPTPQALARSGGRRTNLTISRARFLEISSSATTENNAVLNENLLRSYLAIQNRGGNSVFINFGAPAVDAGFELVAGGFYEPFIVPIDSINVLTITGTSPIVIIEGVEVND